MRYRFSYRLKGKADANVCEAVFSCGCWPQARSAPPDLRRPKPPTCRCLRRRCRRPGTRGRRRFKRLRLSAASGCLWLSAAACRLCVSGAAFCWSLRVRTRTLLARLLRAALRLPLRALAPFLLALTEDAATGESVCLGNPESSRAIPIASPARRNSGKSVSFCDSAIFRRH